MNPNHLTSAMIDKIVERKIEEMAKSPDTAIRQLLNYSSHFSFSRFKVPIFSILQHLLANKDSQYHIMLQNLLNNTTHSAIKNLGINLGYNSWTKGAQAVRATAQKAGYCIPWIIIFRWNPEKSNTVNLKNMSRFIRDGNKIGIYAFCIRQEVPHQSFGEIFNIFSKHSDSTFFWLLPNQMLAPVHLDMIRKCENVLTLFDGEGSYSLRNSSMLRERKALYGIYHIYSSFNTSEMRPDQWLDYYKMYQSSFIFMLPSDSCSEEDQKEASSFIYDARLHQKFPYYIVDFYSDIKEISRMISGTDCYLEIDSSGQVLHPYTSQVFVPDSRLAGYLASSMPAIVQTADHRLWHPAARSV